MTLISVQQLVKKYGGLVATDHVNLDVADGEIHAVIGPNGAGKTTLVKQLSGEVRPTSGSIVFDGRDVTHLSFDARARAGIARSFQITSVFEDLTILENVLVAIRKKSSWRNALSPVLGHAPSVAAAMAALEAVDLHTDVTRRVASLSYGEKRQLELAMALAMQPRVLLLDEPMAGMSHHEARAVISLIRGLKGRYAILLVEHDMDAVFSLADRITVLVYGRPIATGTVAEIRADPEVRRAYLGDDGKTPAGRVHAPEAMS